MNGRGRVFTAHGELHPTWLSSAARLVGWVAVRLGPEQWGCVYAEQVGGRLVGLGALTEHDNQAVAELVAAESARASNLVTGYQPRND